MKTTAMFQNGMAKLILTPEDEWEQKLVGAIAKGGETLSALVKYEHWGHCTYGKCKTIEIQLEAIAIAKEPY